MIDVQHLRNLQIERWLFNTDTRTQSDPRCNSMFDIKVGLLRRLGLGFRDYGDFEQTLHAIKNSADLGIGQVL